MSGFRLDNLKMIAAQATVTEWDWSAEDVRAAVNLAIAKANKTQKGEASVDPVGPNMQPRMLHISAWICHAEKPNLNGFAFRKADLEQAVKNGLFAPPYFGMIDFNHDFSAYGAWYKTEFAFDSKAGLWGVIAHGAIWAWRYEALADRLLAMQERNGHIDVSIAVMFKAHEDRRTDEGVAYMEVHNPVFFTTSVLDVDPADPFGRGVGSEDPAETNEQRAVQLVRASLDEFQEAEMDELMQKIEAALGAQFAELKPMLEAAAKLPEVQAMVEAANAEKVTLEAKVVGLEAQITTLTAAADSVNGEKAALEVALEAAKAEIVTLNEQNTALAAFKNEIETANAEAEKAAKEAARLAEIPETVLAKINEREDKEAVLADFMSQSDEKWGVTKALFEIGPKSKADKSAAEGELSSVADRGEGSHAISRWKIRRR